MAAQQARSGVESHGVFRKEPGLPVEADIVAVVLYRQPAHFYGFGIEVIQGRLEVRLKRHIFCLVAGGVGVGDVRGDDLLSHRQQVHVSFEVAAEAVQHDARKKQLWRQPSGEQTEQITSVAPVDSVKSLTLSRGLTLRRSR